MAKIQIFLFVLAFLFTMVIHSQQRPFWGLRNAVKSHIAVERDTQLTDAWVSAAVQEIMKMRENRDSCRFTEAGSNLNPGFERITYRLKDKTCIGFPNGDIVYVRCHSAHENPRIGDVCVASDGMGRFFVSFSHICGGQIQFYYPGGIPAGSGFLSYEPHDAATFFTIFRCDTDDMGWEKWEDGNGR